MTGMVLVTNGGPHPPEKWAVATSEQIMPLASELAGDRLLQAKKLQIAIADALVPHHHRCQHEERGNLTSKGDARFDEPHNADHLIEGILADIEKAAAGTPWEDHFKSPHVQAAIGDEVHHHLATIQHIERLWHADRNPSSKAGQDYKARFHSRTEG